jgi:ketosteroid isomerase-like protein
MADAGGQPRRDDGRMTNTETIQGMYAAFGRGDIPAILDCIAEEVDWCFDLPAHVPGAKAVPMFQHCTTPAEVADRYFRGVGETMDFHRFAPRSFFADGDDVVVILDLDYTARPTGRRVVIEEVHHFTFGAGGKIVRYRPFLDTATVIEAYGG